MYSRSSNISENAFLYASTPALDDQEQISELWLKLIPLDRPSVPLDLDSLTPAAAIVTRLSFDSRNTDRLSSTMVGKPNEGGSAFTIAVSSLPASPRCSAV